MQDINAFTDTVHLVVPSQFTQAVDFVGQTCIILSIDTEGIQ